MQLIWKLKICKQTIFGPNNTYIILVLKGKKATIRSQTMCYKHNVWTKVKGYTWSRQKIGEGDEWGNMGLLPMNKRIFWKSIRKKWLNFSQTTKFLPSKGYCRLFFANHFFPSFPPFIFNKPHFHKVIHIHSFL